jgi:tRNA U38,U39,U40 pseudouridine synthase TruA
MLEELRAKINADLPQDIKIFCILHVSNNFNAKNNTSYREYSYYLPTFYLTPI